MRSALDRIAPSAAPPRLGEHPANVAKELGSNSRFSRTIVPTSARRRTVPAAIHIATVLPIMHELVLVSSELPRAPRAKQKAFARIVKIGRTYPQNATPLTRGREFFADAAQLEGGTKRLELAVIEFISPKNELELLGRVDACVWYDAFNSTSRAWYERAHSAS